MLTAGDDWIASLDQLRGLLSFYGADGTPLGRVSLTQLVGTIPRSVYTIRAAGNYLGVGHDTTVTTRGSYAIRAAQPRPRAAPADRLPDAAIPLSTVAISASCPVVACGILRKLGWGRPHAADFVRVTA